jgi:capsular exopolysaccharide synthesis family protein
MHPETWETSRRDSGWSDPHGNAPLEGKHLLEYLRVLFRRRYTAIAAFLFVVAVMGFNTYTATPIYEAPVQLLIEQQNQNVFTLRDGVVQEGDTVEFYQTQFRILQSRTLAKRTIDALKLWDHPELGGKLPGAPEPEPVSGWRSVLADPAGTLSRLWMRVTGGGTAAESPAQPGTHADGAAPPESAQAQEEQVQEESAKESQRISAFLGRLTVAPVVESRLVDVKFRSLDPQLAADVANALAREYIDQTMESRFAASKQMSDWLGQQLLEQRKVVARSEAQLQQYREKAAVSFDDRQNIVVQKLNDISAMVTKAKADRIDRQSRYEQLKAIQDNRASLDTFPSIQSNPYLQQLKTDVAQLQNEVRQLTDAGFGERHPDVIKARSSLQSAQGKLDAELAKFVEATHNDFLGAQELEDRLTAALEQQKREALAMNRKQIDYDVLQREVTSNQQIFESLLQRSRESGIAGEMRASNIRIVDNAEVPQFPVWPNKPRNLFYSILLGVLFGVGLAFFVDYLDDRICTPDQIKAQLGLPFLGLVPLVKGEDDLLLNNGIPANFAEAFRAVRTNVLFAAADQTRSLVVTSTGPGEGKTVIAANLALGLALTGQRVLLVDVDLRKPRTHDVFRTKLEPGLSELISGTAKAAEAIRPTSVPSLWVMPAGHGANHPAELVSSPRFRKLLRVLQERFDWVILDTPPVMAVTDAAIVAHLVPAVVFVIGAELTSVRNAENAIEQLQIANARFVGAVLNRVNLKQQGFFYSEYYRREYGEYYTAANHA